MNPQNMGMQVVALPTPGVVGGRPRKEPLCDTEVIVASATIPTEITIFQNFAQFRAAPSGGPGSLPQSKEQGRDTNLQGGQSGLPQSTAFFWFQWRQKLRTYDADLTTDANKAVSVQMLRLRQAASTTFRFSQTDLITVQFDELPDGVGPQTLFTTKSDTTCVPLVNGVPDRRNAKDVTVSGRPVAINALEQFRVIVRIPNSFGITPTINYYITEILEGLLVRGITG